MLNVRGATRNMAGAGDLTTEVIANDFSKLDVMARHQLLQAKYGK